MLGYYNLKQFLKIINGRIKVATDEGDMNLVAKLSNLRSEVNHVMQMYKELY